MDQGNNEGFCCFRSEKVADFRSFFEVQATGAGERLNMCGERKISVECHTETAGMLPGSDDGITH